MDLRLESEEFWDGKWSLPWVYDDGGRREAGFKGWTGDCVCRSIAIAAELPYQQVYDALNKEARRERPRKGRRRSTAREGVKKATIRRFMETLGWTWVPTMKIGSGCKVHLVAGEIPMKGRLVVSVSKHLTAVIDGEIHDTHDPQRQTIIPGGPGESDRIAHRCVYGYWYKE